MLDLFRHRKSPNSTWLVTSRHDLTRSTCRAHAFGCIELVEQHDSTRLARHVERVETWRAKWNLCYNLPLRQNVTDTIFSVQMIVFTDRIPRNSVFE